MSDGFLALLAVTASIAAIHTLAGPDHYIPFVAMARAGQWSRRRVLWVTFWCGVGHVASSVILGALGVALAVRLERLVAFETSRADLAAWGLIAFGLVYATWGIRRARRGRIHTHPHVHLDGTLHRHSHTHHGNHLHAHAEPKKGSVTPWVLFVVFLLGPCEPLVPILMAEGMVYDWLGFAAVALVFALVTISLMMGMVLLGLKGLELMPLPSLERYTHAFAGLAVLVCGLSIRFLGL